MFSLSPEMARMQPDRFEHELFDYLGQQHPDVVLAWHHNIVHGLIDPQQLELDTMTFMSRTVDGRIVLGVAPMGLQDKKRLLFRHDLFGYQDEVGYRLNHENTHPLGALKCEEPAAYTLHDLCNIEAGILSCNPKCIRSWL